SQGGTLPPGLLDGDDPVADAAQLDYSPADGHVSLSNPPSFIWIPIRGTSSYTLEYASDPEFHEANTYRVEGLQLSVYTPSHTLRTDTYWYWRVTALDAAGRVVAQSRARRFSIHPDAAELPLPPLDELKAR